MTCLVDQGSWAGRTTRSYPLTVALLDGGSRSRATRTSAMATDGDTSALSALVAQPSSSPDQTGDSPPRARSADRWSPKPCPKCHGPKPAGRGRRLCDSCAPDTGPIMCHSCGDQPVVPRGLYCQDCREMKEAAAKVRRKARERVQKGKPCAGCKRPKPIGRGLRYCKTCRRKRKGPRMCERQCGRSARSPSAHLCAECKAQAVEDRRAYGRLWMRENGHSQKGRGRKPDAIRMETRLKAERAGRTLELVDPARKKSGGAHSARIDAESFPRLPVAGFVAAVDRLIVKERAKLYRLALMSFDGNDGCQGVVCKACGVTERRLTEWRNGLKFDATLIGPRFADGRFYTVPVGAGTTVSFDRADRFLTSSGLLWRDVWDGHEVCSNGRTVEWVFESTELLADAV